MGKLYTGDFKLDFVGQVNLPQPWDDRDIVEVKNDLYDANILPNVYQGIKVVVLTDGTGNINTYEFLGGTQSDPNNWIARTQILEENVAAITNGEGTAFPTRAAATASPEADGNPFVVYGEPGFNGQYRFDSTGYILISLYKIDATDGDVLENSTKQHNGGQIFDQVKAEISTNNIDDADTTKFAQVGMVKIIKKETDFNINILPNPNFTGTGTFGDKTGINYRDNSSTNVWTNIDGVITLDTLNEANSNFNISTTDEGLPTYKDSKILYTCEIFIPENYTGTVSLVLRLKTANSLYAGVATVTTIDASVSGWKKVYLIGSTSENVPELEDLTDIWIYHRISAAGVAIRNPKIIYNDTINDYLINEINSIKAILFVNDVDLDTAQERVDKLNELINSIDTITIADVNGLQTELDNLQSSIDNLTTKVNENTYKQSFISDEIAVTWISGFFYASDKTLTPNNDSSYALITAVEPNSYYVLHSVFSGGARKILLLNDNEDVLEVLNPLENRTEPYPFIIATGEAVKIALSTQTILFSTPKFYKLNVVLKDVFDAKIIEIEGALNGIETTTFTDYRTPYLVLGIDNDADNFQAREYVQAIHLDALTPDKVEGLKVNGNRCFKLQRLRDKGAYDVAGDVAPDKKHTMTATAPSKVDKSNNIYLRKTKLSAVQNTNIRFMAIGDSTGQKETADFEGNFVGGWSYPSKVQELSIKDNADVGGIKVLNIGTTNNKENISFDYQSTNYPLRSFAESRGGWCAFTYLRHAMNVRLSTAADFEGSNMYVEEAWDSLGLGTLGGTRTYVTYSNTVANNQLIAQTSHAKYAWDYTATLWGFLKNRYPTLVTWGATYSGSEDANIDTAMNELFDNPINPFFNRAKAVATANDPVSYAFDYVNYLSKFKTLDDDGVTRLVVGTTAGTEVTDVNLFDVCTPTHVSIGLGTNDNYTDQTEQNIVDDLKLIASRTEADTGAKTAIFFTRQFGTWYKDYWQDVAFTKENATGSVTFSKKWEINKRLMSDLDYTVATPTKTPLYLPVWFLQGVIDASSTQYQTDFATGGQIIVPVDESSHAGILTNEQIAYQILSWIYYTTTQ